MVNSGLLPRPSSNSNITSLNVAPVVHSSSFKKLYGKSPVLPEPSFCSRLHRTIVSRSFGMLVAVLLCLASFFMLINVASRVSVHVTPPENKGLALDDENILLPNTKGTAMGRVTAFDSKEKSFNLNSHVHNIHGIHESESKTYPVDSNANTIHRILESAVQSIKVESNEHSKSKTISNHADSINNHINKESAKKSNTKIVSSESLGMATDTSPKKLSEGLLSRTHYRHRKRTTVSVHNKNIPKPRSNTPRATHSSIVTYNRSIPAHLLSSDQPLPASHPCHGFTLPPPPIDKKRTGPRPCPVCYLPVEEAIKQMPVAKDNALHPIKSLTYIVESQGLVSREGLPGSEFGGHPSLDDRKNSFHMKDHMSVHCGFAKGNNPGVGTGFDIDEADLLEMQKCSGIVVASAIFGNYDLLQQPRNISPQSRKNVCFFMFVDEETNKSLITASNTPIDDPIWRVVVVHNMPYSDARRNGKIPKLLLHRLFPNARFSLWIDGKLKLIVDPYQILERFLWRQNMTFAISRHYKRFDVLEEAEANKAAAKYSNASIDAQIEFYRKEGIGHFNAQKSTFPSDVPEGCVIIREHSPITNLFTCLWFNEVDRFTSRDQLSFAIVRNKLTSGVSWGFSMFLDCERRNFVVQGYHKDLLEQLKTKTRANATGVQSGKQQLSLSRKFT